MSVVLDSVAVQMMFSPGVWTNVIADVRDTSPIKVRYGIFGTRIQDRLAGTGTMTFTLDNSTSNSGGLLGYYSPDHSNCRAGFDTGLEVRLVLTYSGVSYYKFRGKIKRIQPTAGEWDERDVAVTCVDWMDEAARTTVTGLATQLGKRSDELWTLLVDNVAIAPAAQVVGLGLDTYDYAFDKLQDEKIKVTQEMQRILQSEFGLGYIKGDTVQGGTLVFENRQGRSMSAVNTYTLDNTMYDVVTYRDRDDILTKVLVTTHPARIDAAATTVLFALESVPPSVQPGVTRAFFGPYRDPANPGIRIGGLDQVAPVATTDYTMNTAADGSGSDVTANFTVVATFTSNGVYFNVTNNHASVAAFITKLQCRGKGVYRYVPETYEATASSTVVQQYGENVETLDMPYQEDSQIGIGAAEYTLNLASLSKSIVEKMAFHANDSDAQMLAALGGEPSVRVGLKETVTGLTNVGVFSVEKGFYINGIELEIGESNTLDVQWTLMPGSQYQFWILEQVGASELDATTRLGYF